MFTTLRSRLIASYVLIVVLCLALAAGATLILMQRQQERLAIARLRNLSVDLARRLPAMINRMAGSPRDLLRLMREEALALKVRMLVVDGQGLVRYDTALADATLVGQQVLVPRQRMPTNQQPLVLRHQIADGQEFFLVLIQLLPLAKEGILTGTPPHLLALAAPVQEVRTPWSEMLPPLALSALLALVVAGIAAFYLSKSVTHPLSDVTRAAEEIGRGNYRQSIPVRGTDEIARLAESFNHMAREVETARQTQHDFLANVSHDLKTPLTSIQGFSQAILEGAVTTPEGYRRSAEIINQESERMGRLVGDLLKLARLESGQADLAHRPIDLHALLSSRVAKLEPRFDAADLSLYRHIEDGLPPVERDEHRLEEVLENLLDNAISYTASGGEVRLTACAIEAHDGRPVIGDAGQASLPRGLVLGDGRWVVISVSDTGMGIPPEDIARVFERFYRADKSRSTTEGSGLGLAIAKEIVTAHGGDIGVESEPGVGTTFVVALPAQGGD